MKVREYGRSGPVVVLLHGGPGAPGYIAPLARSLSDAFRVLEPFQRGSGSQPLTVARHVEDLHDLIEARSPAARPMLVGHSWGAMLGLAYAAAHPDRAAALVLIGCGTFDSESRRRLKAHIDERMDDDLRERMARLDEIEDRDERFTRMGPLLEEIYSFDRLEHDSEMERCDARAYEESSEDMARLQAAGIFPAAFAAIDIPVLMLHGAVDPHPGSMIRDSLAPHVSQLEYREWERCGHEPWLERAVRDDFLVTLRDWLTRHAH